MLEVGLFLLHVQLSKEKCWILACFTLAFTLSLLSNFIIGSNGKEIIVLKEKNPAYRLQNLILEAIIPLYIQQEVLISTETVLYPVFTVQLPEGVNMSLILILCYIFYQHSYTLQSPWAVKTLPTSPLFYWREGWAVKSDTSPHLPLHTDVPALVEAGSGNEEWIKPAQLSPQQNIKITTEILANQERLFPVLLGSKAVTRTKTLDRTRPLIMELKISMKIRRWLGVFYLELIFAGERVPVVFQWYSSEIAWQYNIHIL